MFRAFTLVGSSLWLTPQPHRITQNCCRARSSHASLQCGGHVCSAPCHQQQPQPSRQESAALSCRRERTGCPVAAALPIASAAVGGGVVGSRQGVCSVAPWVARLDPRRAMAAASQAHEPAVASSRHTQLVGAGECAGMCGQRGTAAAAHQGSQLRQVLWWRVESCMWGRRCCPQLMQQCAWVGHSISGAAHG
jgi:hypothetical protein